MAISGMFMQEADQIKWSTWWKPVSLTCEKPPHRIRIYEWETSLESHKEVSSHPHPLLPTFPSWKEDDVNTEHKEGRSTEYVWEQGEGCGK